MSNIGQINRLFIVLVLYAFSVCSFGSNSIDDINILVDRLVYKSSASVSTELNLYDSDTGCFKDIDYSDSSHVYWQPSKHLERIYHLTGVYINPKHILFNSPVLYNVIERGLFFWCQRNPRCNNWWYNQVLVPQQIGLILINLRYAGLSSIPSDLEKDLIEIMKRSVDNPTLFTAANRTDVAIHWIYRAILTNDTRLLKYARDVLFEPLAYSITEGITIDNCFLQHGKQLYIGGYGLRFLDSMTQIADLLYGTNYYVPSDKINILCNFARNTFFRTIRGCSFSYNVVGRNISRKGALSASSRVIKIAQRLIKIDPQNQEIYKSVMKQINGEINYFSNKQTLHTHYYYSDYTLHTCPLYTFDIRFSSRYTQQCETLNNENLKGYFLTAGSYCLMTAGDEYDGIFPVWNWTRIPGVTAPQITEIPTVKPGAIGQTEIAGGVSDSITGVTAFALNDTSLHVYANKSWFFFDREIVCLGSDIHSNSDKLIETSINQCKCPSGMDVLCNKDSLSTILEVSDSIICHPEWVLFNHVGYVFPESQDVIISKREQIGNWFQLNNAYDKTTITHKVFYLGINHGHRPKKGSYSYRIIPGIDSERNISQYLSNSSIEIVQHSSSQHAVYDHSKDLLHIVFFKSGHFQDSSIKISVNQPSVMIIRGAFTNKHPILHIAKLTKNIQDIRVALSTLYINKQLLVKADGINMGKSIRINY